MDTPFKLIFFNNQDLLGKEIKSFADNFENALQNIEEFSYSCKELQDIRVKFESNQENLDLWIEVMDMLPLKSFSDDEEEIGRFLPSNNIRGLYLNSQSDSNLDRLEYSPLLPGLYKIIIRENNLDKYYSFLKVDSLQINEEQLNIMRNEVETILKGLAKEVATKRSLSGNNAYYDNDILQKYHQIISQSNSLIINLNLIINNPQYKIKKRYIEKMLGQPTKEDSRTASLFHNRSKKNKVASFSYYLDYDISVNNNLKYMVENILRETLSVESYINENLAMLTQELITQTKYKSPTSGIEQKIIILNNHIRSLHQLKANLIYLLKQSWIEKINGNMKNQDRLPRIPYHRTIYSIYQKINRKGLVNLNPLENYIYSWKETSKLFEIWGFLKLLLILKDNKILNISNTSGWIFNSRGESIYPLLTPNEEISLSNDSGLKLVIRYDSIISEPNNILLSIDNPLLTLDKNNRPDFRVDIYSLGYYKGSILADFAVQRVLGIFPKKNDQTSTFIRDTASKITRCSLSPGMDYENIENEFIEVIEELISN